MPAGYGRLRAKTQNIMLKGHEMNGEWTRPLAQAAHPHWCVVAHGHYHTPPRFVLIHLAWSSVSRA